MKNFILILSVLIIALFLITGCGANEPEVVVPSGEIISQSRNILRVGMECAYAPYNWAQSDDSNGAVPIVDSPDYAYGYDVMIAKYLAEKMGYDLEIYKIDWDSLPVALQAEKLDCVIAGQSITSERLETVDFTTPYYYASIVALVNSDGAYASATGISDLENVTCTSQINTVWYNTCLPQIKNANILTATETASQMLIALDSKKVDLVVTDMPTALAATKVYPNMKILDLTNDDFNVSEEEINIGISVKKGNTELLNLLNESLSNLTIEDFENMMNEAITVQPLAN